MTIPDFAVTLDMRQRSVPDFPDYELVICDRGTGAQQFRGLKMSEIADGCRCPGRYKFEFSFVGNDRRPSQKSGTHRENRNDPDSPDLSPFIPGDQGYLRFRAFISRQNLGQLGNSKLPDCLGFFRHMKTRLKQCSGQRESRNSIMASYLQTSHIFF